MPSSNQRGGCQTFILYLSLALMIVGYVDLMDSPLKIGESWFGLLHKIAYSLKSHISKSIGLFARIGGVFLALFWLTQLSLSLTSSGNKTDIRRNLWEGVIVSSPMLLFAFLYGNNKCLFQECGSLPTDHLNEVLKHTPLIFLERWGRAFLFGSFLVFALNNALKSFLSYLYRNSNIRISDCIISIVISVFIAVCTISISGHLHQMGLVYEHQDLGNIEIGAFVAALGLFVVMQELLGSTNLSTELLSRLGSSLLATAAIALVYNYFRYPGPKDFDFVPGVGAGVVAAVIFLMGALVAFIARKRPSQSAY